jgi:radical SAM superfamily enzyme YgiQ (UPF0313 family)
MEMKILYKPDCYSQQRQKQKKTWTYPVHLEMEATKDFHDGNTVHWDNDDGGIYDEVVTKPGRYDFLSLPFPDRVWTNSFDKRYQVHGNFKHLPATYIMAAEGCHYGKCSFCKEQGKQYKVRPVEQVVSELWLCHKLGVKEAFDDSATFPTGDWLKKFCNSNLPPIKISCNMRLGADVDFKLMKQAGFRMLLYGIESANQSTLNRIQKGTNAKDIIPTLKAASMAGLEPHVAVMFGQAGEGKKEELETLRLVHYLLRKGYAKTAQASVCRIDGQEPKDTGMVGRIYEAGFYPDFWFNKAKDLRTFADWRYLLKSIRKGIIRD